MLTPIRECGSIEIYALEFSEDCGSRIPNTILKATLLLPSLNPGVSLRSFTTHSSPVIARPPQYKMAIPTAGSHIHVMSVTYDAQFGVRYCLYVPNRALVSYAASTPRRAPIPWKSWGPENTRFMKQGDNSTWLRYAPWFLPLSMVLLGAAPLIQVCTWYPRRWANTVPHLLA